MFPFDIEDIDIEYIETVETEPKEWEVDFATGRTTGRIVTGLKAIETWAYIALQVQRYRYQQYSWLYGNEMEDLIGKGYSKEYIDSEAKRMITECLIQNEWITGISDFISNFDEDKLKASFCIETNYGGRIKMNV